MHESLSQTEIFVTVDLMILTVRSGQLRLMLARRTAPPYQGCRALPGRFIERNESAEKAALTLLQEILPVQCGFTEQLYTFSGINRDPRGRVISIAYMVILPDRCARMLSDFPDSEMEDFAVRLDQNVLRMTGSGGLELSASDLAFDHADIVEKGITRLRGKITYTDIGFYFLEDPDSFSLRELQTVFEAVLDHPMDSSNFRRMILTQYERSGKIIKKGKEEKAGIGRPSVLYRFRKE